MKKVFRGIGTAVVCLLCLSSSGGWQQGPPAIKARAAAVVPSPRPSGDYGAIPLQFIPNKGQADRRAVFYVQGRDKSIYFSQEGLTFVMTKPGKKDAVTRWSVALDFVSPNKDVVPTGLQKSGAVISYFTGKPENWKTGLSAFSKIGYRELWPGIDLVYSGTFNRMKYEFVVRPGADPARIKLICRGAEDVRLTEEGRLEVGTPAGGFLDDAPVAYQEIEGKRVGIPVSYALDKNYESSGHVGSAGPATTYGFNVGEYDRSRTLVLDPAVLVSCGFIGGSGADRAHGIDVDLAGNAYIAGETSSLDMGLPSAPGPGPTYSGGDSDAFVAKLNPEGTALVYCGYIGGVGRDAATDIKVDSVGNVYVAGVTDSPETSFPVMIGPDLTYNGGESDAFVAKVNAEGLALVYCGYIGGVGRDAAASLAISVVPANPTVSDLNVNVYVAGRTSSKELTFPVTVGPDLTYNGGVSDAFVAKVKFDGTGLDSCGYIGGAGDDEATSVAISEVMVFAGLFVDVYVTGRTSSSEVTFPVAVGPDLTYNGGVSDAFVAKVKFDWTGLDFCGYIGGAGLDVASDLFVFALLDNETWPGSLTVELFITGYTSSTESTFPVVVGPDLTYNGGEFDAFVAHAFVDPLGQQMPLDRCGYIGGAGSDEGTCVVKVNDGVYVAGNTSSAESTFPVAFSSDMTYNGGASDAFLAKLTYDWKGIAICGFLGGSGADRAEGMAVRSDARDVLIAGSTDSTEIAVPAVGGPDLTYKGAEDALVARVHIKAPTLISLSRTSATAGDPEFTLTLTGSDFIEGAYLRRFGGLTSGNLPTTYVSETELRATVPAEDLASPDHVYIAVQNPDGESSEALDFNVRPGPLTLTSLSPTKATAGGSGFFLTLYGSGFMQLAADGNYGFYGQPVLWNGASRNSEYISYTELQVHVSETDIANGGEFQVIVKDPGTNSGDSNALIFPVTTFSMIPSLASKTVTAGEAATYSIQVTPQFGPFDTPVSFSCSGLPAECTASFSPKSVTLGAGTATTTLTLATSGSSGSAAAAILGPPGDFPASSLWLLVSLLALPWLSSFRPVRTQVRRRWLAAAAAVCLMVLVAACGMDTPQSKQTPTPKGTYQIAVQGKSGNLTVSTEVTLIVK